MILRPYKDADAIREMVKRQEDMKVPTELLPTCPHCSKPMTMNLRFDDTSVEDEGWHRAAARYESFLRTRAGQKILFLELGVGYNTPVIIKYPFWWYTEENPNAFYACINKGEAYCPEEIADRSVCMDGDIRGYCSIWFRKRGHWFPNIKFEEGMVIQRKRYLDRLTSRIDNGMIKVITRVRGSGKSFLLFNLFYQF